MCSIMWMRCHEEWGGSSGAMRLSAVNASARDWADPDCRWAEDTEWPPPWSKAVVSAEL